jgi:hypothetical protein
MVWVGGSGDAGAGRKGKQDRLPYRNYVGY